MVGGYGITSGDIDSLGGLPGTKAHNFRQMGLQQIVSVDEEKLGDLARWTIKVAFLQGPTDALCIRTC